MNDDRGPSFSLRNLPLSAAWLGLLTGFAEGRRD